MYKVELRGCFSPAHTVDGGHNLKSRLTSHASRLTYDCLLPSTYSRPAQKMGRQAVKPAVVGVYVLVRVVGVG